MESILTTKRLRRCVKMGMDVVDHGLAWLEERSPVPVPVRTHDFVRLARNPAQITRFVQERLTRLPFVGKKKRAVVRAVSWAGARRIEKRFDDTDAGKQALANEILAQKIFGDRAWKVPILEPSAHGFFMPELPADRRLDVVAPMLSPSERRQIAVQAVGIAFDIFLAGYAHRDFHARNMFLVDDQLLVGDFETFAPTADAAVQPFPSSYDLTGKGLASPHNTRRMCYSRPVPESLESVLGVPLDVALDDFRARLKDELRAACRSFQATTRDDARTGARRHRCKTDRIYGSFSLPHFTVTADEAQRDAAKRFARFGIVDADLRGKTLLDLGSNVGAMTFAAQAFGPAASLGVEYDVDKVAIATRVARFCGLQSVRFRPGNIDQIEPADLGDRFDVVFCLAIEAHVASVEHLFDLLAAVTGDVLFFEGNAGCDIEAIAARLRARGFAHVELRGMCDDDFISANNVRPLLVARRA